MRHAASPKVRSPLRRGTLVYHGTATENEFDVLNGPAWVSDSFGVARHFANRGASRSRVVVFRVQTVPRLAMIANAREWASFVAWATGACYARDDFDDDVEYGPYEIAEMVCDNGIVDGWIIPANYPEGADIMLCNPSRFLGFVEERRA